MSREELVQTLDYILNRCNERDIEVVAGAVIRRRKDIAMFGAMPIAPDPKRLAQQMTSQLNVDGNIEGLKKSIRDYAIRIIRQEAPELTDDQIAELTGAWIPDSTPGARSPIGRKQDSADLPKNLLASMIDQFVAFSFGQMEEEEDAALRKEMGAWPDKYWKSFPQVIRLLISDYIKGEIDDNDFKTRIGLALKNR